LVRSFIFGPLFGILSRSAPQLSALPEAFSYSPITLPTPTTTTGGGGHTLARRDLFDVRFQLSLSERDEQSQQTAVTAFVDAPADLVPGTYEGGLKTWECALDLAAYLDRDVLGAYAGAAGPEVAAGGRRVRRSRLLEVRSCSPDGILCYRG
jgi:protein-histidine N-methyltransferase